MIEFDTLNLPAFELPNHPLQAIAIGLGFSVLSLTLIVYVMSWHPKPVATNRRGTLGKFK